MWFDLVKIDQGNCPRQKSAARLHQMDADEALDLEPDRRICDESEARIEERSGQIVERDLLA